MRFLPSLILLCLAAASVAQEETFAGTKTDVIKAASEPAAAGGMMPFFQLLIALGIVLALLKFVLPKFMTKLNKRLVAKSGSLQIEESAAFAGGNLYVVQAKHKTLLLSASSSGVTLIADLTELPRAPVVDEPVFLEVLEQEEKRLDALEQLVSEPPMVRREGITTEVTENPEKDLLLDNVQQLLEEARSRREKPETKVVVEVEEFKTRLPENTKPLPPITPDAQPWQPRRITSDDRSDELEAVLRRLQQLSS